MEKARFVKKQFTFVIYKFVESLVIVYWIDPLINTEQKFIVQMFHWTEKASSVFLSDRRRPRRFQFLLDQYYHHVYAHYNNHILRKEVACLLAWLERRQR